MTSLSRPNRAILDQGIDLYRDCMRKFLIRNLKSVQGRTLNQAIQGGLPDWRAEYFRRYCEQGKSVEDFIDVNDFPRLIFRYKKDTFSNISNNDLAVLQRHCNALVTARNEVAHPKERDVTTEAIRAYLFHVGEILGLINCPDEAAQVTQLVSQIPDPTTAQLAEQLGQMALTIMEHSAQLERLDSESDRAMYGVVENIVSDISVLRNELDSSRKRIEIRLDEQGELLSILREKASNHAMETPNNLELQQLIAELEHVRDIIADQSGVISELSDKIDHFEALSVANQTETVSFGNSWLGQTDDLENNDQSELPSGIVQFLQAFSVPEQRDNDVLPNIWPGARYYCSHEGCNFYDGTRKAWWNKYKAVEHAETTGHEIEIVEV